MRSFLKAILISIVFPLLAVSQQRPPSFETYPASVYTGKIHNPKWIKKYGESWRDDLGKIVEVPEINFAGRYYIAVHSCGTGCRFYTLTDLATGKELDALSVFSTGEPPPKTKDGFPYFSILYFKPNSRLLVAQYEIESATATACRERFFVLEKKQLVVVQNKNLECRKF